MSNTDTTTQATPPTNTQTTQTSPDTNTDAARNPDGSLKSQPLESSTPEPKKEGETEKKPDDKKTEGAPDAYTFTAPEGYEVAKEIINEVTPIFKELNLTNDQAQKLVSVWNKYSAQAAEAPMKLYEETRDKWRGEIINDKDLGNGKDNMKPEVQAQVAKAIDSLPGELPKAFREAMDMTGAGDNPAFVRALVHWSKSMTEGTKPATGSPAPVTKPGSGQKSLASSIYPELSSTT